MQTVHPHTSCDVRSDGGETVSVWITEDAATTWRISLDALFEGADRARVGELVTECSELTGACRNRLIAVAAIPGARGFEAHIRAEVAGSRLNTCQIGLRADHLTGGARYGFEDLEIRQKGSKAGAAGITILPAWKRRVSWTAWATAAGANVQVMGETIGVPMGGSVRDSYSRLPKELPIIFAGTSGYLVSWE